MKKGDIVKFRYFVRGETIDGKRSVKRYANQGLEEIHGIVLGYSFIQEGEIVRSDPNWLREERRIKVMVIEPLTNGERYIAPIRVLEDDLTMYWPHPLNQGLAWQLFDALKREA